MANHERAKEQGREEQEQPEGSVPGQVEQVEGEEEARWAALKRDVEAMLSSLDRVDARLTAGDDPAAAHDERGLVESLGRHLGPLAHLGAMDLDDAKEALRRAGVGDSACDQVLGLLERHPAALRHVTAAVERVNRKIGSWRSLRQQPELDLDRGWAQADITIWGTGGGVLWHFREDLDDVVRLSAALAEAVRRCVDTSSRAAQALSPEFQQQLAQSVARLAGEQKELASALDRLAQAKPSG